MIDLTLISNLEVYQFDTPTQDQRFLAIYNGRQFEINGQVAELIAQLKRSNSLDDLVLFYHDKGVNYTKEQMGRIINKCLGPILVPSEIKRLRPFIYNKELISPEFLNRLSAFFKILMNKWAAIPILAAIFFLETLFFLDDLTVFNVYQIDLMVLGGLFLLLIISSFFHELGHASACKYMGVNHGGIGFGLYINFPVFYTDVSNIWHKSRMEKIIVDIAGIYYQFIFLIPILFIYLLTGSNILKYFILVVNLNVLITLNPFFKFDGYWIVSDWLRIPNLRQRTNELLVYCFNRIRGKKNIKSPYLLSVRKLEFIFVSIYTVIVNLFFGFYIFYFIPKFLIKFFSVFPGLLRDMAVTISEGHMPDLDSIQIFVSQLIMFAATAFIIYKMTIPWIRKIAPDKKH